MTKLTCDMTDDCFEPVTYIDSSGYAYCTGHGLDRQTYEPCRKLRPHELHRLQRGEQLRRY
jgi:hypothetical protein